PATTVLYTLSLHDALPIYFKRRMSMSAEQPIAAKVETFQQIYQQIDDGSAGDPDPELFPGTPLARLSDYVRATKALQSGDPMGRSEEHTSELQSRENLVCR